MHQGKQNSQLSLLTFSSQTSSARLFELAHPQRPDLLYYSHSPLNTELFLTGWMSHNPPSHTSASIACDSPASVHSERFAGTQSCSLMTVVTPVHAHACTLFTSFCCHFNEKLSAASRSRPPGCGLCCCGGSTGSPAAETHIIYHTAI